MTASRASTDSEVDAPRTYPPAPEGQIIYAIGDIHGRRDLLAKVLLAIDADKARELAKDRATAPNPSVATEPAAPPSVLEVYLGDYIDRGPDSRGVVDALIDRSNRVDAVFLRGNHEQFLLDFLAGSLAMKTWNRFGALPTFASYGVRARKLGFLSSEASRRASFAAALPDRHVRFYADTVPYYVAGSYLFAHAGIRPGIPLERQQLADLTCIRRSFLDFEGDFGRIVVHGHTPVEAPEFIANRINLDTTAYSTGRLTCLKINRDGPVLLEA